MLVDHTATLGAELGRGVDLMNLGAWWLVGAGVAGSVPNDGTETPVYGGMARGSVGATYNVGTSPGFTLRLEGGVQYLPYDLSVTGGFALGPAPADPLGPGWMSVWQPPAPISARRPP